MSFYARTMARIEEDYGVSLSYVFIVNEMPSKFLNDAGAGCFAIGQPADTSIWYAEDTGQKFLEYIAVIDTTSQILYPIVLINVDRDD